METIGNIPFVKASVDKKGNLTNGPINIPPGTTDLVIVSHGWNNDDDEAKSLYTELFTNFAQVPGDLTGKQLAIIGVFWPSKKFDELVSSAASSGSAQGAAALSAGGHDESDKFLVEKLEEMKKFFKEPGENTIIEELKALIPGIKDKGSAQEAFVAKARSLLDPSASNKEDSSIAFFKDPAADVVSRLSIDEDDLGNDLVGNSDGSASLPLGVGTIPEEKGGAAGFLNFLSGIKSGLMNVLNFTTYYEMKARAGTVGQNGVAKLMDQLAPSVQRIHLVGHSFGGRVVTAAAAASATNKLSSMTLLQSAFSHNGFSKSQGGFFRSVVDNKRVAGPILVTHTKNDKAVGIAYPLASRLAGQDAADFGGENDKFGGIGRNGAIKMEDGETVKGTLQPSGSAYQFKPGTFFNLEASQFVSGHSDVKGEQVAYAIRRAIIG